MTNPDFWLTSGFHLLERDGDGRMQVTDEFLRAYFRRPEMVPVEESCDAERGLHAALLDAPRRPVTPAELDALADPDAADNYRVVLALRERLVAAGTVEACYRGLFGHGSIGLPPLFIDQMAHVILRNILDGVTDPIRLRAAELLFRAQKVSIQDESVLLADDEIVEMRATLGDRSPVNLLADGKPQRSIELDVINSENGALYWERSDQFDMVLDVGFARAGLDALCRVLEAWVGHLLGVAVAVQPVESIQDEKWVWHVGLDAEATAILNDLYNGETLAAERQSRILALFRLRFAESGQMLAKVAGKPVYLAAAMTPEGGLRLKPQNLLVGLPLTKAT